MEKSTPKMTLKQAQLFWNNLPPEQKIEFNKFLKKLNAKDLILTRINVDDNEQITSIILDPKDKPGKSMKPFMKHFDQKIISSS
ncbi:hypothetical protein UFOVP265_54 [uncultured Caudovirales phage]|jgi:hypothetical protein|uniref:Uncharacterized protein n=1 Tax=uncultured Caudovirales phage TaxID=2100421 RepID=A0A6J5LLK5_9CAUD|nr:hypothetical protein UFOVP265_54 [uncultured Caudovirales phage]